MKNKRAYKKKKKRVARGSGSGHGKTACRGNKGYYSRTGSKRSPGFEGGQMTFIRRMPKRGFNNTEFKKDIIVVNLNELAKVSVSVKEVTPQVLRDRGIIKNEGEGVKILGTGSCPKGITVHAHFFSEKAKTKIEAAGGKVVLITQ